MTVTKDMKIIDVVNTYGATAAQIMTDAGLHCVGCHVSAVETVEQGCKGHGMKDDQIDELISKINDAIKNPDKITEGITITDAAAQKFIELKDKENNTNEGLRIEVIPGGCSGMSYDFSFDDKRADDIVIEKDDLKVFVDKETLQFMSGSTLDFVDNLQGSGFKVTNPKATSTCGCGSSFA